MWVPVTVPSSFRIIAHRGASGYAPENTRAAFELAYSLGCREVETDVRLSADGQAVLCHDGSLKRYGHRDVSVESLSWEEIKDLDMGSWYSPRLFSEQRMLRLKELIELSPSNVTFHLELKGDRQEVSNVVFDILQRCRVRSRCVVTSFSSDLLIAMKACDPDMRLGWLVQQIDDETLSRARELDLFQLCPHSGAVDSSLVSRAKDFIEEVRAWGVNGSSQTVGPLIRDLAEASCNGATLNWPDWAVHR